MNRPNLIRASVSAVWPLLPFCLLLLLHPVSPDEAVRHAVLASFFSGWARLGFRAGGGKPVVSGRLAVPLGRLAAALPPMLFALGYAGHLRGAELVLRGAGAFLMSAALFISESALRRLTEAQAAAGTGASAGRGAGRQGASGPGFGSTLLAATVTAAAVFFAADLMPAWAEAVVGFALTAAASLQQYRLSRRES